MKKYRACFAAFILILSLLSGCQASPEKDAVVSKNDGSFQKRIYQTNPPEGDTQAAQPSKIQCSESFTSTDGSVSFNIQIDEEITPDVSQVIEVSPHRLTEEDISRVAKVLLGDVDFYERRPSSNPQYSKAQYQEMISRLSAYASQETLTELMGEKGADTYLEFVRIYIDLWTGKYETAPEKDPRVPCDWMLKKERNYNDSDVEIGDRTVADDSDVLYATAVKNGIEYSYSVITKDSGAYRVNLLNLDLTDGLGLYPVNTAIYRARLCRTDAPTQAQIEDANRQVQDMLEKMELGHWQIAQTTVETEQIGDAAEYSIHIMAVPILNGIPTIYGQVAGDLQENYSADYAMPYAEFSLSANGEIVYFNLVSPIDTVETHNENVAALPISELMDGCIQQLSFNDADAYGLPASVRENMEDSSGQKILCQVDISRAEYALGRVRKAESDDHYYYIPVLVLRGVVNYIGEQDGQSYYTNYLSSEQELPTLIWINAIDGSIIGR